MVQTISNPDGTVSILHVDPNNPVITLPDGTTAQVQGVAQLGDHVGQGVHTLAEVAASQQQQQIEVASTSAAAGTPVEIAASNENNHFVITGDDGQGGSRTTS